MTMSNDATQADEIDILAANLTLEELTAEANQLRREFAAVRRRLRAVKEAHYRKASTLDKLRRSSPAEIEQMLMRLSQ